MNDQELREIFDNDRKPEPGCYPPTPADGGEYDDFADAPEDDGRPPGGRPDAGDASAEKAGEADTVLDEFEDGVPAVDTSAEPEECFDDFGE